MKHPYYVIGGGIIGSSVAREISGRGLEVVVLEKEKRLGEHASGRNSGVIHSGINQFPGAKKSSFCLEGSKRLRNYCREKGIPMNECGTIVVAQNKNEEFVLYTLLGMGGELGVEGLKIIGEDELREKEPAIRAKKALISPTGAVVDSQKLLEAVAQDARKFGAEYRLGEEVVKIDGNNLITNKGHYTTNHVINCAGLQADKIAHMFGVGLNYKIIPFRGEYMQVDAPIESMVYQAPDLRYPFLGIHFTRSIDGEVLAGPSAALAFGRESYKKEINLKESIEMFSSPNFWRMALSRGFLSLALHNAKISLSRKVFLGEINRMLVNPVETITPYRSGIRAQLVDKQGRMANDFVVEYAENSTHVLNAVSPGMTSSLVFAEYVVDEIARRMR